MTDGKITTALAANLDQDPADELVLELRVNRRAGSTHTHGTVEYAVLDWTGTSFVRLSALEAKLAKKVKSRKDAEADPLGDVELRAALGDAEALELRAARRSSDPQGRWIESVDPSADRTSQGCATKRPRAPKATFAGSFP